MLKKLGMVTVGAAAGLVALAPIASATTCDSAQTQGAEHHGGHHKGHGKSHGHGKNVSVDNSKGKNDAKCTFNGGNAEAGSGITGDSLANTVTQTPVAGNNIGNLGNCSSLLNGNFSNNHDLVNINS